MDRTPRWISPLSIEQAHTQLCAPGAPYEMHEVPGPGGPLRAWVQGPRTLRDVFDAAATFGERPCMVYESHRVRFDGFTRAVAHLASHLAALGVGRGDRVALAASNRPEWAVAFLATTLLGAIAVPLNAWWTGPELAYGLSDSGARVLVADTERLARVQATPGAAAPGLARVWIDEALDDVPGDAVPTDAAHRMAGDTALHRWTAWLGLLAGWHSLADCALPAVALAPDDDATIFYTSGTTGSPKGALGTHRNAVFTIVGMGCSAARLKLRGGHPPPPVPARAVLLSVPLFHVTGCLSRLLPALHGGAKLVMMRRWNADQAIALIDREHVTAAGGVPTIALQLLDAVERCGATLPSLVSLSFGGAPMPPSFVARIRRVLPHVVPGSGYGMTEMSAMITHHQGEEYDDAPDSCGPALPAVDIRVTDERLQPLPPEAVGELWCRGPNMVKGYWRKPEATAQGFHDGWVRTGDLARIDAQGRCFIVDRIKDVIIRGGEKIYSIEIEDLLMALPGVQEAAVFALPHPTLGEVPAAALQCAPGAFDVPQLDAYLRERIAAYKLPVQYLFMDEPLPHNANGKVMKRELAARLAQGRA